MIKRIEIIKGPMSVFYGADTTGGVNNIFDESVDKLIGSNVGPYFFCRDAIQILAMESMSYHYVGRRLMMEREWGKSDKLFMFLFTVFLCTIIAFIARDFAGIVMDIWYGFGSVMMEFGSVIEQLPV